jgi:hypothetical protein
LDLYILSSLKNVQIKLQGSIREAVYPFYFRLFSEGVGNSQIVVGFRNGGPVIEYEGEKRNWEEERLEAKEAVIMAGFNPSDYF